MLNSIKISILSELQLIFYKQCLNEMSKKGKTEMSPF